METAAASVQEWPVMSLPPEQAQNPTPAEALLPAVARALAPAGLSAARLAAPLATLLAKASAACARVSSDRALAPALAEVEALVLGLGLASLDGGTFYGPARLSLQVATAPCPGTSPLAGLGRPKERAGQAAELERRVRAEASRFAEALDKLLANALPVEASTALLTARCSLLRLLALAACGPALLSPESPESAPSAVPGARERLVIEVSEHASDRAALEALRRRWLAELSANPRLPQDPLAALLQGAAQLPHLVLWLRDIARVARARRLSALPQPEATVTRAALLGFQPTGWSTLRTGAPAAWVSSLCPPLAEPGPAARLAAECDAALEAAGRLREATQSPAWELAALAGLLFSRTCSVLALWGELARA